MPPSSSRSTAARPGARPTVAAGSRPGTGPPPPPPMPYQMEATPTPRRRVLLSWLNSEHRSQRFRPVRPHRLQRLAVRQARARAIWPDRTRSPFRSRLRSRNSMGSMPSFAASRSICDSTANATCVVPGPAHAAGVRVVRVRDAAVELDVRPAVGPGRGAESLDHEPGTERGVRAGVGEDVHRERGELAVASGAGPASHRERVALGRGHEGLGPAVDDLHRPARSGTRRAPPGTGTRSRSCRRRRPRTTVGIDADSLDRQAHRVRDLPPLVVRELRRRTARRAFRPPSRPAPPPARGRHARSMASCRSPRPPRPPGRIPRRRRQQRSHFSESRLPPASICGAPSASASSALRRPGARGTPRRSAASAAVAASGESATTSATGSPSWRTLPSARTGWSFSLRP